MFELPKAPPSLSGHRTALGLRVIDCTQIPLVNTWAPDQSEWIQGGVYPIDFPKLLFICELGLDTLTQLAPYYDGVEKAQARKKLERRSFLGNAVYDYWGMLNPANTLAVGCLVQALARARAGRLLVLGTATGNTEVMCADILGKAGMTPPDLHIVSIDAACPPGASQAYVPTLIPVNRQNQDYTPPGHRVACLLQRAVAVGRIPAEAVELVTADSVLWLRDYRGPQFQMILADSNHQYEHLLLELYHSWSLLADGGVLVIDDWGVEGKIASQQEVVRAVLRFATDIRQAGYFVYSPADPPALRTQIAFFVKCRELRVPERPEQVRRELAAAYSRCMESMSW